MDKINREQILKYSVRAGLSWVISHFVLFYLFNDNGLLDGYGDYNLAAYILMIVYVVSLIIFDTLLWFIKSQEANRVMKRYWAIICVITFIWLLFKQPLMASRDGGEILILFFIWLLSPLAPMLPFSYLLLFQKLGIEWDMVMTWHSIIILCICLIHFFYIYLLSKRVNWMENQQNTLTLQFLHM